MEYPESGTGGETDFFLNLPQGLCGQISCLLRAFALNLHQIVLVTHQTLKFRLKGFQRCDGTVSSTVFQRTITLSVQSGADAFDALAGQGRDDRQKIADTRFVFGVEANLSLGVCYRAFDLPPDNIRIVQEEDRTFSQITLAHFACRIL